MEKAVVVEKWIKPPELVTYTNSRFISQDENTLVCEFLFPKKYYENDFYLLDKKVLSKGDLYRGKRTFYNDRFYSLLEYYSDSGELVAYYFDVSLPAKIISSSEVLILDIKLDFFFFTRDKSVYLLDEDELEDAIALKEFSEEELNACFRTRDFLLSCLKSGDFDRIFTDYERTSVDVWSRYNESQRD